MLILIRQPKTCADFQGKPFFNILPNTGQENNIAQPKTDQWFSLSLSVFIVSDCLAVV